MKSPGRKHMYTADYDAIADWSPQMKASVAETIAVKSLQEAIKRNPIQWTATELTFKSGRPRQRHIYDRYYPAGGYEDEDKSMWVPDGFFYAEQRRGNYPAHIVMQEVKTGETTPDVRDSQFNRMAEYAHRSDCSVYYSFVEFTDDGFNLSLVQLVPDGADDVDWFVIAPPPGTGIPAKELGG